MRTILAPTFVILAVACGIAAILVYGVVSVSTRFTPDPEIVCGAASWTSLFS